jgi:type II secretory pathway pseudopilin PulG
MRQAFTLVELLVVGVIIVILASLTLFAMSMVAHSTRETKTRATILKLDTAMRQIFESYEDQFNAIKNRIANDYPHLDKETQQKLAAHYIRDLMRMEMPQNWVEVYEEPLEIEIDNKKYKIEKSPLLDYYQSTTATAKNPGSAALLFLIIHNLNPEALEAFHDSEVTDTDGDGLLEFVDAWGRPIQFLRWAPAFPGSDIQQNVLAMSGVKNISQTDWQTPTGKLLEAMETATRNHPDPQDERLFPLEEPLTTIGWFLYPLIYSAGPDGKYGIDDGNNRPPTPGKKEGILDPFEFPFGMPNNGTSHLDNIHNHLWYRSF